MEKASRNKRLGQSHSPRHPKNAISERNAGVDAQLNQRPKPICCQTLSVSVSSSILLCSWPYERRPPAAKSRRRPIRDRSNSWGVHCHGWLLLDKCSDLRRKKELKKQRGLKSGNNCMIVTNFRAQNLKVEMKYQLSRGSETVLGSMALAHDIPNSH